MDVEPLKDNIKPSESANATGEIIATLLESSKKIDEDSTSIETRTTSTEAHWLKSFLDESKQPGSSAQATLNRLSEYIQAKQETTKAAPNSINILKNTDEISYMLRLMKTMMLLTKLGLQYELKRNEYFKKHPGEGVAVKLNNPDFQGNPDPELINARKLVKEIQDTSFPSEINTGLVHMYAGMADQLIRDVEKVKDFVDLHAI